MREDSFETWSPVRRGPDHHERAPFDAIYCISLQDQPDRYAQACQHFERVGIDREVIFYRPARAKQPFIGCWQSHAAVARHCLQQGFQRALILEDDVHFSRPWSEVLRRTGGGLAVLPQDWRAFYVGHRPRKAYFLRRNVLRCMSLCTHAYVANKSLLDWLASTEPFEATIPYRLAALDGAFEVMLGMYALFPMIATQRFTGQSFHRSPLLERFSPYRLSEMATVLLSSWHRRTFPKEVSNHPYVLESADALDAKRILASGVFDAEFYLRTNPDVVDAPTSPLLHYVRHGAREGRAPNALATGVGSEPAVS